MIYLFFYFFDILSIVGDDMNNKGIASMAAIYSMLLLLIMVMFLILGILRERYYNQNEYNNDIQDSLQECLETGEC